MRTSAYPNTSTESTTSTSPFAEGCRALTSQEVTKLGELKQGVPYTVLVPSCLPNGYTLQANSVEVMPPMAGSADSSVPDYEKKPSYDYKFVKGSSSLEFSGNWAGDLKMGSSNQYLEIKGHKALVAYGSVANPDGSVGTVPFEKSPYYEVVWKEGRDVGKSTDINGSYLLIAKNLTWDQIAWLVNKMVSIDEVVPADTTTTNTSPSGTSGSNTIELPRDLTAFSEAFTKEFATFNCKNDYSEYLNRVKPYIADRYWTNFAARFREGKGPNYTPQDMLRRSTCQSAKAEVISQTDARATVDVTYTAIRVDPPHKMQAFVDRNKITIVVDTTGPDYKIFAVDFSTP